MSECARPGDIGSKGNSNCVGEPQQCNGTASTPPSPSFDIAHGIDTLSGFKAPCASGTVRNRARVGGSGGRIRRVSEETAAALSSQQVITDLRSICKELVENAIDAGATSVEVRLLDCGLGGLEVSDNGSGIEARNFDSLGCRHATSKIETFEDVYSKLNSLGFRGEALASLCVVARVSIITRAASESFATRLVFDHHGKQIGREAAAREVGTTVCVNDIFGRLPLRRKGMEQTKSRQLQDALALIQRIALQHASVCRIVLSNFDPRAGSRNTLLTTKGTSTNLLEAALSVYGSKQLASCAELTLEGKTPGREWRLEAVISRPPYGLRSTLLQHFYVRKRAVDFPPLLQKLLNAKWKEVSSRGLFPVCIAFLEVDASLIDVNIRKDKQDVMLSVERDIAHALLNAVTDLLAPTVTSFQPQKPQLSGSRTPCSIGAVDKRPASESQSLPKGVSCSSDGSKSNQNGMLSQQSDMSEKSVTAKEPILIDVVALRDTEFSDETCFGHTDSLPAASVDMTNAIEVAVDSDESMKDGQPRSRDLWPPSTAEKPDAGPSEARGSLRLNTKSAINIYSPALTCSAHSVCGAPHAEQASTSHEIFDHGLSEGSKEADSEKDHGSKRVASINLPTSQHLHPAAHIRDCTYLVEGDNVGIQKGSLCQVASFNNADICEPSKGCSRYSDNWCNTQEPPQDRCDSEAEFVADAVLLTAVADFSPSVSLAFAAKSPRLTSTKCHESQRTHDFSTTRNNNGTPAFSNIQFDTMNCGGVLAKDSAFLFHKSLFRDLRLVGQFNRGFIIAALPKFRSCQALTREGYAAENVAVCGLDLQSRCDNSQLATSDHQWCICETSVHPPSEPKSPSDLSSPRGMSTLCSETELSLFIIDQHASDEKRIFEELNASFNIKMQHLLIPHEVVLPAELVAAADTFMPILRSNGFICTISRDRPNIFASTQRESTCEGNTVSIASDALHDSGDPISNLYAMTSSCGANRNDHNASEVRRECEYDIERECRCWLTAVPVVQGQQLGVSDFTEFLGALASEDQGKAAWKGTLPPPSHCTRHLAEESSTLVDASIAAETKSCSHHRVLQYRPSRVWNILASKACRSAVKIGDPLAPGRLLAILSRMAELQLPFNCPHGRPTMRHLVDVKPRQNKITLQGQSASGEVTSPQRDDSGDLTDSVVGCEKEAIKGICRTGYAIGRLDKRQRADFDNGKDKSKAASVCHDRWSQDAKKCRRSSSEGINMPTESIQDIVLAAVKEAGVECNTECNSGQSDASFSAGNITANDASLFDDGEGDADYEGDSTPQAADQENNWESLEDADNNFRITFIE